MTSTILDAIARRRSAWQENGRFDHVSFTGYTERLRRRCVPEISRFLGIVVRMYVRDHPPAHFHAEYGEYEITVEIESGIVTGRFPRRALQAVLEWSLLHRGELMTNWQAAQARRPLASIEPLE